MVRPNLVLLRFPLFVGIFAVLGPKTPKSPVVLFKPQNSGKMSNVDTKDHCKTDEEKRQKGKWFHFHACTEGGCARREGEIL